MKTEALMSEAQHCTLKPQVLLLMKLPPDIFDREYLIYTKSGITIGMFTAEEYAQLFDALHITEQEATC